MGSNKTMLYKTLAYLRNSTMLVNEVTTNEASPWELLKRKVTPVVQKDKYQRVAEKLHAMLLRKQKENGGVFRHALGWYTYNIGTSYIGIDHKVLHQYYLDNFDAVVD